MGTIIKIGQLLLSLSILIVLHELGHFIFARLFKTRVEKFYLFFDPWFSLFKIKKGETEYGIGWLPLGGYVKISGMIDESMDKEQLKQPAQPYEFRSKKSWQRLLIMLGGVSVNLILGFVIYTLILFKWGDSYLPMSSMTDGVWVMDSVFVEAGVKTGDKIISIGDAVPEKIDDLVEMFIYAGELVVEREGEIVKIDLPIDLAGKISDDRIKNKEKISFYPRIPFFISSISEDYPIINSGIKAKDQIIGINDIPVKYYDEFPSIIDTLRGKTIKCRILRDGEELTYDIQVGEDGKIGVSTALLGLDELEKLGYYKLMRHDYTFLQSIPAGYKTAGDQLKSYIRQFKLIFNPDTGAYKGVGGFGAITNLFPPEWNWQIFWELTAILSLMLAFINVLPIPALDGGHVAFLLYEMVTGRKPGDKFLEYAQIVGMIIILSLVLYANGNDIYRGIMRLLGN